LIRLNRHKGLGRDLRQDDTPAEMEIPTWQLAKEAAKEGNPDEALRWIDYGVLEDRTLFDALAQMSFMAMIYMGQNLGQDALDRFFGQRDLPWANLEGEDLKKGLSAPASALAKEAARSGSPGEASRWIDFLAMQDRVVHDAIARMTDKVLTYMAESYGEEQVEKFWRWHYQNGVKEMMTAFPTAKELFVRQAEFGRSHQSDYSLSEEPDRYVRVNRICGSGGRLRRMGSVGVTKKPYPWSWGKEGIPYYCVHCTFAYEIIPIELQGCPTRITEITSSPEEPCIHYYYKNPESIPEEYFTRLGKIKPQK